MAKWGACLATGETFEYESRVRRSNGEYRWMFHRKVPLRDTNGDIVKWYGSSLDIEERKTAEEQFRRNAQELQRSEFYLADRKRAENCGEVRLILPKPKDSVIQAASAGSPTAESLSGQTKPVASSSTTTR